MIINNSQIALAAKHEKTETTIEEESLEVFRQAGDRLIGERIETQDIEVSLSEQGTMMAQGLGAAVPVMNNGESLETGTLNADASLTPKMQLAKSLLEAMTGHELRIGLSSGDEGEGSQGVSIGAAAGGVVGISYNATEIHHEAEYLAFSGKGVVQTADGRELNIDLSFAMSRQYTEINSVSFEAGLQLQDPLVINFDGGVTELTENTFGFDLDSDGDQENINFVTQGSGLLMLDKNGDGKATNGGELFGPQTGNGFNELAKYDEDGNGFIDEGDSIYSQLQIWAKVGEQDEYFGLAEKDVGAIYLGAISTPFELKNEDNELRAVVRSSSVYVGEEGAGGAVQQIDLVV